MLSAEQLDPLLASNPRIASIILAGGKGKRLYPLTKSCCKPSVSFGGRYRLIDVPISNSLNSNMKEIFILSQYFSSDLNNHIQETYSLDQFQGGSLHLLTPEEREDQKIWYEGTADAVRKNLSTFASLPVDYFLILSGDQLYNMNLREMVSFAIEKNADLTIAALPVTATEAPRLGLLQKDQQSFVTKFIEKPKEEDILEEFAQKPPLSKEGSPSFLASMGIYVFRKTALLRLLKEDQREDFGKHLIPTQIQKGQTAVFLHKGYWEDIGTISSYYEANLALTTNSLGLNLYNEVLPIYSQNHHLPGARLEHLNVTNSLICDGTIVKAKSIAHSLIGVRSTIDHGTTIQHSVLMGNPSYLPNKEVENGFHIGKNCFIQKTIIDENVVIGNNVTLVNKQNLTHYDGEKLFLRDGIIVVTRGARIPDNFSF